MRMLSVSRLQLGIQAVYSMGHKTRAACQLAFVPNALN